MNTLTVTDYKWLLAVPLIPLVGYVVQIFFGRKLPRKGDWLLTSGMFVVMCITVVMFFKAIGHHGPEPFFNQSSETPGGPVFRWFYDTAEKAPGLNMVAGVLYDGLGAAMLMVVGVVSFFVHLFSLGYMQGDRRYHIFFANISLFTFAMLGLVLSDNILFLFIFWELMGLMSYLLIGHFAHDPTSHRITHAAAACKKAFLTTRVGDTCLLFGMAMFYVLLPREVNALIDAGKVSGDYVSGSFRFTELWNMSQTVVTASHGYPGWMTVAGLFVFGGTVGKSAQFPLHIWLPDAMEGPTPVSAMIHAATMVAAGVFLLGRTFPMLSPTVLQVVIATGAFTAIFAATIGCTVNDIKGVLAYSTISQLGFMVAAIGTGGLGLVAGLYHMATHAFFKACLFLSAGSVIHGCHHEQDMQKMGGLRKKMPITFACMLVCTLAISGMPLFSGFYSKDRIIASTIDSTLQSFRGANFFAIFALAGGAMLTTFYMFRLIFLTFFGEPRDHHVHEHAHESPKAMTISLVVLATFAVLGGHVWLTGSLNPHHTWFTHLVDWKTMYPGVDLGGMNQIVVNSHNEHTGHTLALIVSIGVLVLGFTGALWIYGLKRLDPAHITGALGEVYVAVKNKYYVDEFVSATVIAGTMWLARAQTWIDENVVDGVVLGVGRVNKALGFVCAWIDKHIVDGAVNWVAHTCQAFGSVIRLFQTGRIQQYVSFAVGGAILVAAFHLLT